MGNHTGLPSARLEIGEREHRIRVYSFLDDHESRLRIIEGKVNAILALASAGIGVGTTILTAVLLHL